MDFYSSILVFLNFFYLFEINFNKFEIVAFDSTYLLASSSYDKTIKLWNKHNGDLLRTLIGNGGEVWTVAFASNNILASGSEDKTIRLWDTNTGYLLKTLEGHLVNVIN